MKHRLLLIAAVCLALLPINHAVGQLYKWVDSNGTVHYSDKVPPEAAKHGREVKSERGHTIRTVPRAKTAEELEAERREREQREAAEAAKRDELRRKAERDRILLMTFTSVHEIERSRDERLAATEAQVVAAQEQLSKLSNELGKVLQRAADAERAGRPVDSHQARIDSLRKQIAVQEKFIEARRQEMDAIKAKYADDIERFKELKAEQAAAKR